MESGAVRLYGGAFNGRTPPKRARRAPAFDSARCIQDAPRRFVDDLLGDGISEFVPAALHRTSGGTCEALVAAVVDESAPSTLREMAAEALIFAAAAGHVTVESVAEHLVACIDAIPDKAGSALGGWFVSMALDLGAAHLAPRLRAAFARGAIDTLLVGVHDVTDEASAGGWSTPQWLREHLEHAERDDIHSWLSGWAWFNEPVGAKSTASTRPSSRAVKPPKRGRKSKRKAKRGKRKGGRRR